MSNTKVRLPFLAYGMVSKWWNEYQDVVEVVIVDDASVAKVSGGDVDVEPYLNSRNTSRTQNRNSNSQSKIGPKMLELEVVSDGGDMQKWWWYAEVYVGTRTKFGEIWTEHMWWRGSDAARGRMSGFWIRTNSAWKVANPGKIRRNLWMEIGKKWMES